MYDERYFRRWYHSAQRVHSPADRERIVRMVLAVSEYMLGRPVRTVLDIGAGEGLWFPVLRRLRRGIRYLGVDPSEYAVARYGRARHLRVGTLGSLPPDVRPGGYDLVVCSGVLNYLPGRELRAGLERIALLARGVAYLELYTRTDDVDGDTRGTRRPASHFRRLLREAGFRHCGPHCYIGPAFEGTTAELELG